MYSFSQVLGYRNRLLKSSYTVIVVYTEDVHIIHLDGFRARFCFGQWLL